MRSRRARAKPPARGTRTPRTYGPNLCASPPAFPPPRNLRRKPAQPQEPVLAGRPESPTIIHGASSIARRPPYGEYGVSWIARREPCLRVGTGIAAQVFAWLLMSDTSSLRGRASRGRFSGEAATRFRRIMAPACRSKQAPRRPRPPHPTLPLLCAASGYALWRSLTARFPAPRDETQHINDHLRAALAVALV